ncbi:MAG TPA: hypothetical protein VH682_16980 [Gemmataceae bacterium]|jgi:hypothetical protein
MNPQRFRQVFSVFLLAGALVFPTAAQAQSELNKPYELHIVVHVAQNRLLTDVFRERIERELHDGFQAGLGDMGRVEVAHKHPRLADVLARGLKQSLDDWKDRSGVKTHFVLIDFSGVHYEIQARQYDGTTMRASPVVRRSRTRDRDFVAKAAALLLEQDFGILGTVKTEPEKPQEKVRVELRGGALGNMARWVHKDDIFALAPPDGGSPKALKWSLLQVEEPPAENARDGACVCRFFHRYRLPSIAGYHCIKLGTVRTALRLRWGQEMPNGGLRQLDSTTLYVHIRRHGFQGEDATRLQTSTGRGGVLDTVGLGEQGVFTNVAFVSVTNGVTGPKPQVPIALVDDQPIFIGVNATQDPDTLFKIHKAAWQTEVSESLLVQINLFKRLEELGAQAKPREEIIQEAERGRKRSQDDRANLNTQKAALLEEAKKKGLKLDTPREDKRLQELADGELALDQFIADQKKAEEKENDPQRKKWLSEVGQANLLEKDLEFDKALAIYEKIQKEGYKDAELDKHLGAVRKIWKPPANAEHEDARKFIYRVWPTLDTDRLEESMPKVRKALKTCADAGDLPSLQKLFKGLEGHADRVAKELSELQPKLNPDDDEPARLRQKVGGDLLKLGKEIQEEVLKAQPDNK